MRSFTFVTVAVAAGVANAAFQPSPMAPSSRMSTQLYEYIPSGFTKASWAKFKKAEADKKAAIAKKNLGKMGPKGFQSRSFQSFQEALERGEASHLMPVMNAKERVAKGELKVEDIPYMQRGGSWDNSDVKGAKKANWLSSDKEYADGGYKREQSVSVFGVGAGLDWTGRRDKTGPAAQTQAARDKASMAKFSKNYKAPKLSTLKKEAGLEKEAPKKKKMFGLF